MQPGCALQLQLHRNNTHEPSLMADHVGEDGLRHVERNVVIPKMFVLGECVWAFVIVAHLPPLLVVLGQGQGGREETVRSRC